MAEASSQELKIVGLMALGFGLVGIDRFLISPLFPTIAKELHLSDLHIGLMTGFAFAIFYTGLGIPIARFADRPSTSRVKVIAACLVVWSAMTAVCGAAQIDTRPLVTWTSGSGEDPTRVASA